MAASRLIPIDDTPTNRGRATKYIVRDCTTRMVALHSAIKRPDGRYAVGTHKPKSVFTDDQEDVTKERTRKMVTEMELVRVAGELLERIAQVQAEGKKHLPAVPLGFATALKRWYLAHNVHAIQEPEEPTVSVGTSSMGVPESYTYE